MKKPVSTGTAFEKSIFQTCEAYRSAGIATFHKVDPPTRVLRIGKATRTIHLKNPFLDFVGSWTELGGKMLMIECKFTEGPLLRLDHDAGIKASQIESGLRWAAAGAAVAYLWRVGSDTRLVTPAMVRAQLTQRRSLRWCDAHPIPQGKHFILIDFLALLRQLHKPKTPTKP